MGFYGKVTNSSKTQFSFDRIYANRKEMDELCASDGVFVGRYVLIDYDEGNASFKRIYVKKLDNGKKVAWATANLDEAIGELKKGNFTDGETVYEAQSLGDNTTQVIKKYYTIKFVGDSYELVDAEEPAESAVSNYVTNFDIDKKYITAKANGDERAFGRGYDSTVWTKVFEKGQYKYVSVAELNSVVPTFDVTADAPTLSPITPHFDANSTNVYYKLHTQPTWGFRIKKATPDLVYDVDSITGEIGSKPVDNDKDEEEKKLVLKNLLVKDKTDKDGNFLSRFYGLSSDENIVWTRREYNKSTNEMVDYYYNPHTDSWEKYTDPKEPEENGQLSADIYYNKDGFKKDYIYKSNLEDKITIEPSGASGHDYAHDQKEETDPTKKREKAKDIQELSIHLGSIGDAISDMWDMVYGDASANRHHEGIWNDNGEHTWKNEEPAVKLVPKLVNLTKTELEHYKSYLQEEGNKKLYLKWTSNEVKPEDIKDINDNNLYEVGNNTQWSPDKNFYIFNEVPVRNTDIRWRDGLDTISNEPDYESYMGYEDYPPTQSMRLVHSDNDKTIGKEYTYNTDQVSTIAGTINAAHDLMGMIIHEVKENEDIDDDYINNSEENLIYYYPRYYGEGDNKILNDEITLGENRGIILKQAIFEEADINSADDFVLGETYLYDDIKGKYYLANEYKENEIYYKLNTVDLPEEDQTLRKSYSIEPGQFYRKKLDYVYEEVPQAQYWNEYNVNSALWEEVGKLTKFNKERLFTRESKSYSDSNCESKSFYRYIPTKDDEPLLDKTYCELIIDNGNNKKLNILEQKSLKPWTPEEGGDLHFYMPYNLKDDKGYWTISKENDKDEEEENKDEKKKKIYTKEEAETITEAEKEIEKNFYQFTTEVSIDNKELYIPGTYFLKLHRKSRNPKKKDKYYAAPTAWFIPKNGGHKCISLDQLAKPGYTIGDDDDILSTLFKEHNIYYTRDDNYEDDYINLGLFPVIWNNSNDDKIDLGDDIQEYKTIDANDRFEAKWANDFYEYKNNDNKYYLAEFKESRYDEFKSANFYAINNTSKLNETLQRIKEVQIIDKDGVESTVIKTIPESLIDIYIQEDIKYKKEAQELLNKFSTKKYFFNGPGKYIFKFKELTHQEDEKFNALNLKKISGLQKVINDGEENSSIQYEDIPEEDFEEILGLTLNQLLDGKKPKDDALASQLGQKMSDINKRIIAIEDLYNNGKNSNEINNYKNYFNNLVYFKDLYKDLYNIKKLSYLDDVLFDKPIAGKGYYTKRLKYVNLPEEDSENFYNSMAEKGNLFVLNAPKKDSIKPIKLSDYAANAFFVCRTENFEDPLDSTNILTKEYWILSSKVTPADEDYYNLSNYLIPVKVGDKIDNKKDYYIKAMMPATEKFAWDDVEYYKISKIEGNYNVIPEKNEDNENEDNNGNESSNDDNTILKPLDKIGNYYPNPKYFDQVFVIADIGTPLTMYKPGEYYRRITSGAHKNEYELDITENGQSSTYEGSGYYIWPRKDLKESEYLKTANQFFIPNVYYYRDGDGLFWLASEDIFNKHTDYIYYKGKTYYVIKDDLGQYATGAEWNPAIVPVPKSVHLGTRKEKYKWEKLEDFSRTYNTLNGLILRTNKLLEDGDIYTRDTSTIQGCVNRIRDIIAKFEATAPGNLMVVDGYGRIRGSEYSTEQEDHFTNYGKQLNGIIGTDIPEEKYNKYYLNYEDENKEYHGRWIDLQVFNYSFNGKDYVDLETAKNTIGTLTFIGDPSNDEGPNKDGQYKYYYRWSNLDEDTFNEQKSSFYIYDDSTNPATITENNDAPYNERNKYYQLINFDNQLEGRIKYEHKKDTLQITGHGADELEHYVLKFKPKIKLTHRPIDPNVKLQNTTTDSNLNLDILTEDEAAINKKTRGISGNKEPGNDIILYSPIVDSTGHIVAHNEETVTLPYGFKYLEAKNNLTENGLDSDIYSNSVTNTENQNVADTKDKDSDELTYTRAKKTQDTLLFEAKNKWLQVQLTPKDISVQGEESIGGSTKDTLTIAHEVHSIDRTAKSTNSNVADGITPNDTITVQDLEFDNAGHVTENHKHTYTLPYSYKHITTSHDESVNSITQNTNTTTADNTQDKVEFAMGNKWLESKVENDKVTFAHETHWDAVNDNVSYPGNNNSNRTDVKTTTNSNLNGVEDFTVESYKFDNAGHVISHNTHTYELPHNYSFIDLIGTTGSTNFIDGTGSSGSPTVLAALDAKARFSMYAGNRWITIKGTDTNGDKVNDSITFSHAVAGLASTINGYDPDINDPNSNKELSRNKDTLDYGNWFNTLRIGIDEAGHVSELKEYSVKLPTQSISGTGNVVTSAVHSQNNLAFTHAQLMELALSNSITATPIATAPAFNGSKQNHTSILSTDTLQVALGKVPNMIQDSIRDIINASDTSLDTLKEIADWISKEPNNTALNNYKSLVELEKDIYGLSGNTLKAYNSTVSLQDRAASLETAKNNLYSMLGNVDSYNPNTTYPNGTIKGTLENRMNWAETQINTYVTDDLKQKVDAAWNLLQTVQQTTGNIPADPNTMAPTASVDGYMKYHVGRTAPTDSEGNPITNAMWIDTSNMQNILVKFPVYNYNAATGKNVLSWIAINTWQ